jgi:hypothetical protein
MDYIWVILLLFGMVVAGFSLANRKTEKRWKQKSPAEIADVLEAWIEGKAQDEYGIGSFMHFSNEDERIHRIWRRCQVLIPRRRGMRIEEAALMELRGYIAKLRALPPFKETEQVSFPPTG